MQPLPDLPTVGIVKKLIQRVVSRIDAQITSFLLNRHVRRGFLVGFGSSGSVRVIPGHVSSHDAPIKFGGFVHKRLMDVISPVDSMCRTRSGRRREQGSSHFKTGSTKSASAVKTSTKFVKHLPVSAEFYDMAESIDGLRFVASTNLHL
jgi:hypothetical protein